MRRGIGQGQGSERGSPTGSRERKAPAAPARAPAQVDQSVRPDRRDRARGRPSRDRASGTRAEKAEKPRRSPGKGERDARGEVGHERRSQRRPAEARSGAPSRRPSSTSVGPPPSTRARVRELEQLVSDPRRRPGADQGGRRPRRQLAGMALGTRHDEGPAPHSPCDATSPRARWRATEADRADRGGHRPSRACRQRRSAGCPAGRPPGASGSRSTAAARRSAGDATRSPWRSATASATPPERRAGRAVSIVVPTRDGLDHLKRLVARAREADRLPGARADRRRQRLQRRHGRILRESSWMPRVPVSVIANAEPASFSQANTQGAERASHDLLLFLNNDVEPFERGWLRELVAAHERDGVARGWARRCCAPRPATTPRRRDRTVQHRSIKFRAGRGRRPAVQRRRRRGPVRARFGIEDRCPAVTAACLLIDRATVRGGRRIRRRLPLRHRGRRPRAEADAATARRSSPAAARSSTTTSPPRRTPRAATSSAQPARQPAPLPRALGAAGATRATGSAGCDGDPVWTDGRGPARRDHRHQPRPRRRLGRLVHRARARRRARPSLAGASTYVASARATPGTRCPTTSTTSLADGPLRPAPAADRRDRDRLGPQLDRALARAALVRARRRRPRLLAAARRS